MGFKANNFDDINSKEQYPPTHSHIDVIAEAGRHLLLSSFGQMADSVNDLKEVMQRKNAVAMASHGIVDRYNHADAIYDT